MPLDDELLRLKNAAKVASGRLLAGKCHLADAKGMVNPYLSGRFYCNLIWPSNTIIGPKGVVTGRPMLLTIF